MQLSISSHVAYNYKKYEIGFDRLISAIKKEFYMSPCMFVDYHKRSESWQEAGDTFIFDFDLNVSRGTIKGILGNISYLIHTTKSHNKEKNDIICERFRVYIPSFKITLNKKEYEYLMKYLCNLLGADMQCALGTAAFKGYEHAEIEINEGELYNWQPLWNKIKEQMPKEKVYIKTTQINDWHKVLKPENITEGNRNYWFSRYAYWLRDEGANVLEVLTWLNSKVATPLKEKEILSIVKCVVK